MSSHREAPGISNDPAADNTDVYAFVSPDKPDTVTLIANFVPLEDPAGGPNFAQFGDDVRYEINIDNNGDSSADITYRFTFTTTYSNDNTFLYNTGPITSLTSPNWNRKQFVTVVRIDAANPGGITLGTNLACPPVNIGPVSTPNYAALAAAAIHDLGNGRTLFAGQRAEGFYVDLGAIFDLGTLRPLQMAHLSHMPASGGINTTKQKNVHSIALQVPKTDLTASGAAPTDLTAVSSTIGVWATASRQMSKVYDPLGNGDGTTSGIGPFVQVSRLGNPLINEVINPIGKKDFWNAQKPAQDGPNDFVKYVAHPELAGLLNVLYPGAFPRLAALSSATTERKDLEAVLLTGLPAGIIPGFQNYTGPTPADMLRLNMAIPPTTINPSNLGLLGNDVAGFPNGRRVFDDVTTIELRAIAGATYPLIDPSYTPDAPVALITQGLTSSNTDVNAQNTVNYLYVFPYLGLPHGVTTTRAITLPPPDRTPSLSFSSNRPGFRERGNPVSEQSRRSFLKTASLGAAVTTAAVVTSGALAGSAGAETLGPGGPAHDGPLLAWIKDPKSGTISVLVGDQEVLYQDAKLATWLAQIAGQAKA